MEDYTLLTDPDTVSAAADRRRVTKLLSNYVSRQYGNSCVSIHCQADMSTDANEEGLSATTGLHWSNGIGSLPGSNLKV